MQRTWFITGTSSGFGRIMTEQLLARGDRVAATLRTPSALAELQARYPERLWVAQLDVTDEAAIDAVLARAFSELGGSTSSSAMPPTACSAQPKNSPANRCGASSTPTCSVRSD